MDDAKRLVRAAKFPPVGTRGFGSPFAMEKFGGISITDYLQQANDSILTIVQIETKEALENVGALRDAWRFLTERRTGERDCQGARHRLSVCWSP